MRNRNGKRKLYKCGQITLYLVSSQNHF